MILMKDIVVAVSRMTGVSMADFRGRSRTRHISRPRMMAYYYCRTLTGASLPAIGKVFNRDHTSIISGVRVIHRIKAEDPIKWAKIEENFYKAYGAVLTERHLRQAKHAVTELDSGSLPTLHIDTQE